jgi:heme oxygenase-like protein
VSTTNAGEAGRLREKLDFVLPELAGATAMFLAHPRIADLFPEFLFGCYCLARASVPLMEATRQSALSMAEHDDVCAALAPYLEEHIVEEKGHDEWFLDDLRVLGWDRATVLSRLPPTSLAVSVGAQYYWALHYHPVAILGFLTALEGNPPSRALIDQLIHRTGHDPEAFRTLIEHAELDPHHGEELNRLLDDLPLTMEQSTVIGLSALHTLHMEAVTLGEILDAFRPET